MENPRSLYLLFICIPVILGGLYGLRYGRNVLLLLSGGNDSRRMRVFTLKWISQWAAFLGIIISVIIALAGPRWGETAVQHPVYGADVIFTVDVSRSMLAGDIEPSRLDAARRMITRLIRESAGSRFGIAVFKGGGRLIIPLTEDTESLYNFLDRISPAVMSAPGTNIQAGLQAAYKGFIPSSPAKRIVVLFTDGEDTEGNPRESAVYAEEHNISLIIVQTGTAEGSAVILPNGEYIKNEKGERVISRADGKLLRNLADTGRGLFVSAESSDAFSVCSGRIHRLASLEKKSEIITEKKQQYPVFLLTAFIFMILFILVRVVRWADLF